MAIRKGRKRSFSKHIRLPHNIFVGRGVLGKVEDMTNEFESTIVITGKKTEKIAGNKVSKILKCDKVNIEKSDHKDVEKVSEILRSEKIDVAVAVGGGKIIDVTKLAAFKNKINFITVPTNCASDVMASPMVSITNGKKKESISAIPPIGVIADVKIIKKSPYRFTSAGFGDAVAKYSAVKDWNLGHIIKGEYYGDYASSLSLMISKMAMNNARNIRKRSDLGINVLLEALISSGAAMGIAGSSRPASGSEHKFSHALDMIAKKPAMHGFQCGVGTIIMTYLHGGEWERVKEALETAKCPTTAKKLGMSKNTVMKALLKAREIKPERYTIVEHIKLDEKIAEKALKATGVI